MAAPWATFPGTDAEGRDLLAAIEANCANPAHTWSPRHAEYCGPHALMIDEHALRYLLFVRRYMLGRVRLADAIEHGIDALKGEAQP